MHRDLRPENIVLNLNPLEVRLINFTAAYPSTQKTKGSRRGSPGYFPDDSDWRDGSISWDLYSLGVIVLEADMGKDALFDV